MPNPRDAVVTRAKERKRAPRADPLKAYKEKRDFTRTAEPKPKRGAGKGWRFVVQKHDARRLHFDLRLELGGTLKSWAITRGPSLVAGEKRLAVRTEDHPMQYLDFEGVIPKGQYGGGSMIVWDQGKWSSAFDPDKGLKKGHLDITLAGTRLKGRWHLVRMKPRPGEKKEQWLLIKAEDEFVRRLGDPDITEEMTSFLSGRTTEQLAAEGELRKDHADRAKVAKARKRELPDVGKIGSARKGILPVFLEPSLPQVTAKAPSGSNWVHEIKYDGYRIQARIDGGKVQLLTRKGLDWTARFPNIPPALKTLGPSSALIDGEIVVEGTGGVPSFSLLQAELQSGKSARFRYFMFDLLYCEGFDLTNATLLDRKSLLQEIADGLSAAAPLRFSEHLAQDGPTMFEHACRLGLEGIVSKRADLPYKAGRGEHWLKTKATLRQEFVILGYMPSTVAKGSVGAILVGYYADGALHYAGRVGTGYSTEQARTLRIALDKIAAKKLDLANKLPAGAEKGVHWAEPELVCEVEFRGWTADQLLRQAAFKGLRDDRPASEIVVERTPVKGKSDKTHAGLRERLTHPDRILWPEQGVTKEGLAEFYADIADWILPHITGRPLSLMRAPSGIGEKTFFAKHEWNGLGEAVQRVDVGEKEKMLALDGFDGLLELVQAAIVEIHPWGSTLGHLDTPDRLIFDLDPGEDVPWSAVIDAALDVRRRLDDMGLKSFVKTSGGKGLHVVLPILPNTNWDDAKTFTHDLANAMAKAEPDRYVATMAKSARRGRIFIDYLRNGRGSTAVAAYSTRATPSASVSTPISWDELSEGLGADHFKIDNLRQRLDFLKTDPWADFFTIKQKLPR